MKFFWLDRADTFSFRPKFLEILVEWIRPTVHMKHVEENTVLQINSVPVNDLLKYFDRGLH